MVRVRVGRVCSSVTYAGAARPALRRCAALGVGADEPYSGLVNFTDGTSHRFSTRERPHLVFADPHSRHIPSGVFTAVSPQPISPACDGCSQHACSQCKVTPGRDWTFTQFMPFANFRG